MTICMAVVADGIQGDPKTYSEAILGYNIPFRVALTDETQGFE